MKTVPTVGRIVWYYTATNQAQPYAAKIAFVNPDGTINISWLDHGGNAHAQTAVPLWHPEDGLRPHFGFAEWMPYQLEQDKKNQMVNGAPRGTEPNKLPDNPQGQARTQVQDRAPFAGETRKSAPTLEPVVSPDKNPVPLKDNTVPVKKSDDKAKLAPNAPKSSVADMRPLEHQKK